jgi:3D (Asp-Asp-Asp) domain-containing protein
LDKQYLYDMSGKRFVFALLAVYMSWTNAVCAAEIRNNHEAVNESGIFSQSGPSRSDFREIIMGYLYGVPKELNNPAPQESLVEEGPEQKILNKWKEKQSALWNSLPRGKFEINASAYTASSAECGKSDGITASGLTVENSRTLACPASFPFGAIIAIDGYGTFRCEDRGGAIRGNHFDIYMKTRSEAFAFGRRRLYAEVVAD